MSLNKDYNVKLNRVYSTPCRNCGELTKVQDADGEGLCGSCGYHWLFGENRTVGKCVKCNIDVTVGNWLRHDTKTDDERNHPLEK